MFEKHNRVSDQSSIRVSHFFANKGVGLSLDNGPSRKALKILLYTLYMLVVRFIIS